MQGWRRRRRQRSRHVWRHNRRGRWDRDRLHRNRRPTPGRASRQFCPADHRLGRYAARRHHCQIDYAFVTNLPGPEIFCDKVERKDLVPRNGKRLPNCQRFKPVLHEPDLTGAVINKISRYGCGANLIVVNIDKGTGRIAADRHPALDTAERSGRDQHPQAYCQKHTTSRMPLISHGGRTAERPRPRAGWTSDRHVVKTTECGVTITRATCETMPEIAFFNRGVLIPILLHYSTCRLFCWSIEVDCREMSNTGRGN